MMTDNYNFIKCPACGKLMKKVYLEKQDFVIDVCLDGCGGIWLDTRELKKIDEQNEDISALTSAYANKTFEKADGTTDRICPVCHTKMVKNHVSSKMEITIDECYSCGGKFFDYKEIEAMRAQYKNDNERVADVEKFCHDEINMRMLFQELCQEESD